MATILLLGIFSVVPARPVAAAQDGDFTYSTSGDPMVATVTSYTGAGGAINIPATLGGYPTVAIGDYAFSTPHYPLTSLTFPDSVTSIGIYAFANCNQLSSVDFGNGLVTIGHHAFYYCYSITSMTIPDSVTSIGLGAFYNCGSMTLLTIGNNVATIGAGAFSDCMLLPSIVIPDSVTIIEALAFNRCSSLVQVHFGTGLTMLGFDAFSNCTSLATVSIPDNVTSIGYGAFSNCPSLASVTIGSGVTSVGYEAFRNCTGLTSIAFLGGVAPAVGADWVLNTPSGLRGHAYADSDFPAPGNELNGLLMGEALSRTPSAPTDLIATGVGAQANLTWNTPTFSGIGAITSYRVYRSASESGTYVLVNSHLGLSYSDSGLINGQTYWYKVSAVNAAGEGTNSSAVSAQIPQAAATSDNTMLILVGMGVAIVAAALIVGFVVMRKGRK